MNIKQNLETIKASLPGNVTLIAVSKTKPVIQIREAYDAGQRDFGENKAQEMTKKWEEMPKDIHWHMIGHLQRNKVKYIAPYVHLIHAVDSLKLLKEINKQAQKNNRIINCLLQVYIAKEETKFGFDPEEITQLLESEEFKNLKHIRIKGLMGMATFTENKSQIESEFHFIKSFFDQLKNKYGMTELSTGMSGDYTLALQYGSTMVRIGSAIFGERNY
ncbi:MAG: YggS family pyridoxal phosphate-dependent enzyme [Flavobacteriaceae bacterium]|nr:YggS family pyridoxal phosphate-dependent enzyme [Flavobacteriaceae bacterium]